MLSAQLTRQSGLQKNVYEGRSQCGEEQQGTPRIERARVGRQVEEDTRDDQRVETSTISYEMVTALRE